MKRQTNEAGGERSAVTFADMDEAKAGWQVLMDDWQKAGWLERIACAWVFVVGPTAIVVWTTMAAITGDWGSHPFVLLLILVGKACYFVGLNMVRVLVTPYGAVAVGLGLVFAWAARSRTKSPE